MTRHEKIESAKREYGRYIKSVRESQGLTRYEVAERAGISEELVCSIEAGEKEYTIDDLLNLTNVIGVMPFIKKDKRGHDSVVIQLDESVSLLVSGDYCAGAPETQDTPASSSSFYYTSAELYNGSVNDLIRWCDCEAQRMKREHHYPSTLLELIESLCVDEIINNGHE